MKPCDASTFHRCPPGSDLFKIFSKIRQDKSLTNEQAFWNFWLLQIVVFFGLLAEAGPMLSLTQMSKAMAHEIFVDVHKSFKCYGHMTDHEN